MLSERLIYPAQQIFKPNINYTLKPTHSLQAMYVAEQSQSAVPSYSSESVYLHRSTYTSVNSCPATFESELINTLGHEYSSPVISSNSFSVYPTLPTIATEPTFSSVQGILAPITSSQNIHAPTTALLTEEHVSTESANPNTVFSNVTNLQTQDISNDSSKTDTCSELIYPEGLIEPEDLGLSSAPDFSQEPILLSDIANSFEEEAISAICTETNISLRDDNSPTMAPCNVAISSSPERLSESDDFSQRLVPFSDISLNVNIPTFCLEPEFPVKSTLISNDEEPQKPILMNVTKLKTLKIKELQITHAMASSSFYPSEPNNLAQKELPSSKDAISTFCVKPDHPVNSALISKTEDRLKPVLNKTGTKSNETKNKKLHKTHKVAPSNVSTSLNPVRPSESFSQELAPSSDISLDVAVSTFGLEPETPVKSAIILNNKDTQKQILQNADTKTKTYKKKKLQITHTMAHSNVTISSKLSKHPSESDDFSQEVPSSGISLKEVISTICIKQKNPFDSALNLNTDRLKPVSKKTGTKLNETKKKKLHVTQTMTPSKVAMSLNSVRPIESDDFSQVLVPSSDISSGVALSTFGFKPEFPVISALITKKQDPQKQILKNTGTKLKTCKKKKLQIVHTMAPSNVAISSSPVHPSEPDDCSKGLVPSSDISVGVAMSTVSQKPEFSLKSPSISSNKDQKKVIVKHAATKLKTYKKKKLQKTRTMTPSKVDICPNSERPSESNDFSQEVVASSDISLDDAISTFCTKSEFPVSVPLALIANNKDELEPIFKKAGTKLNETKKKQLQITHTMAPSNKAISVNIVHPPESDDFYQELTPSSDISLDDAISTFCSEPEFPVKSALISNNKALQKPIFNITGANKKKRLQESVSSKNKFMPNTLTTPYPKSIPPNSGTSTGVDISVKKTIAILFVQTNKSLTPDSTPKSILFFDVGGTSDTTSTSTLTSDKLVSSKTVITASSKLDAPAGEVISSQTPISVVEVVGTSDLTSTVNLTPNLVSFETGITFSSRTDTSANKEISLKAGTSTIAGADTLSMGSELKSPSVTDSPKKSERPKHFGPVPILKRGIHGNQIIVIGGRRFSKQKQLEGNKVRWFCSTHAPNGCKAYLHTLDNTIVKCVNKHNHKNV